MSPEDRHRESQFAQHQAEQQTVKLERFRSYEYLPQTEAVLAFWYWQQRMHSKFCEAEFRALLLDAKASRYDDLRT